VEALTGVSLTHHDHGGPLDRGIFLKDFDPQKMPSKVLVGWRIRGLTVVFTVVYSIREEM
jgi:hypothetical protein